MRYFVILLIWSSCLATATAQSGWQRHDSPTSADLHNMFFTSDSLGWIISHTSGVVLHTNDSGKNWFIQARLDSTTLEDIYFLDNKTGWISGENGLLFKTTDGGQHWNKQKVADEKSWIYSIHFLSRKKGIAIGMRECRPMKVFLSTGDGGKNWAQAGKTIPESFYTTTAFINDSEGYSAGLRYILYTSDGGETWKTQFADTTSNPHKASVIRDLTFSESSTGWAVGYRGLVMRTKDGENWESTRTFTKNRLRSIAFTSPAKGYIAGDSNKEPGVLHQTNNSGKTWQTVLTNTANLHRITLTNNTIWLVGDDGTILSKPRSD